MISTLKVTSLSELLAMKVHVAISVAVAVAIFLMRDDFIFEFLPSCVLPEGEWLHRCKNARIYLAIYSVIPLAVFACLFLGLSMRLRPLQRHMNFYKTLSWWGPENNVDIARLTIEISWLSSVDFGVYFKVKGAKFTETQIGALKNMVHSSFVLQCGDEPWTAAGQKICLSVSSQSRELSLSWGQQ
jgi:hypothetical protein